MRLKLLVRNGPYVYIKNMWIKQLCNHKVWDFTTTFRVRKLFGTFEKRAPGFEPKPHSAQSSALTSNSSMHHRSLHDTDSSSVLIDCYKFSYLVTFGFFIDWIFKSQQDATD